MLNFRWFYTQNYLFLSSPPFQEPKVGEAKGLGVVFFSILFKPLLFHKALRGGLMSCV